MAFKPNEPFATVHGYGKPRYVQDGVMYDHRYKMVKEDDPASEAEIPPVPKADEAPKAEPKPTDRKDVEVKNDAPKPKAKAAKPKAKAKVEGK